MQKLKTGDEVIVIAGRDKGKRGKIQKVISSAAFDKFLVAGINMVKKHQKPNPATGQAGGIIERESLIAASNVAIFNSETGKGDRVGFRMEGDKKIRFFKSNSKAI